MVSKIDEAELSAKLESVRNRKQQVMLSKAQSVESIAVLEKENVDIEARIKHNTDITEQLVTQFTLAQDYLKPRVKIL
jgi:hypothetical protein